MVYLYEDYQSTHDNLRFLVQLYHDGRTDTYRLIAMELRRLLCDVRGGKDLSLLPKALPEIHLQPLFWSRFAAQNREIIHSGTWLLPGQTIESEDGSGRLDLLFDQEGEPLSVDQWVQQPLIDLEITIEKFLSYVAYFESPSAPEAGGSLTMSSRSLFFKNQESRIRLTVAIAEYILESIHIDGEKAQPKHRTAN